MEAKGLFSQTVSMLGRALDLRSMKHNVLASNIANIDTPNYKSFDIMVEEELKREMRLNQRLPVEKTDAGHLSARRTLHEPLRPTLVSSRNNKKGDGNTVDIDKEMARLSSNNLMYNAMAQSLSKKLAGIKTAIQGGR